MKLDFVLSYLKKCLTNFADYHGRDTKEKHKFCICLVKYEVRRKSIFHMGVLAFFYWNQ